MVYLTNRLTLEYTKIAGQRLLDKSEKEKHGEVLNVLTKDIDEMSAFVPRMIRAITRCLEMAFIFIFFFSVGFYFGFLAISAACFCFALLNFTKNKISHVNKELLISSDKRISFVEKVITKRKSKEFPTEEKLMKLVDEYVKKKRIAKITEWSIKQGVLGIIELFRWGTVILGIYLFVNGQIEIGITVILYSYFGTLNDGFKEFSEMIIRIKQYGVSKKRFISFCENADN